MPNHSFKGPVDQVFSAVEIHNHYHGPAPEICPRCQREAAQCKVDAEPKNRTWRSVILRLLGVCR